MHRFRKVVTTFALTLAAGGACFQFGGCNPVGLVAGAISSFNPCGTILACDPRQYQFLTSGIDGPGVRPDIDPLCTYPPFCNSTQDPIFGGISPFAP